MNGGNNVTKTTFPVSRHRKYAHGKYPNLFLIIDINAKRMLNCFDSEFEPHKKGFKTSLLRLLFYRPLTLLNPTRLDKYLKTENTLCPSQLLIRICFVYPITYLVARDRLQTTNAQINLSIQSLISVFVQTVICKKKNK